MKHKQLRGPLLIPQVIFQLLAFLFYRVEAEQMATEPDNTG